MFCEPRRPKRLQLRIRGVETSRVPGDAATASWSKFGELVVHWSIIPWFDVKEDLQVARSSGKSWSI